MVNDNKDLKKKLIELDRILEDKIRQRDAKLDAVNLKMYDQRWPCALKPRILPLKSLSKRTPYF